MASCQRKIGYGVIWDGIPFETPVIPAKAGIQSVGSAFPKVCGVDSRFRGNDCGLMRPCLANDTTTHNRKKRWERSIHTDTIAHCKQ